MSLSPYEIIMRKRKGESLSADEINFFINGFVNRDISEAQVAAWLMAAFLQGINSTELFALTAAMLESGKRLRLGQLSGPSIDKHSTGGVGDKISFIVAPLAAACGVRVPMLSGRSLGHTGGTLDKLESVPGIRVNLSNSEFYSVLEKTGLAIASAGADLVPADRQLYRLRDLTATVDSIPLIASSIMSKKLAVETSGIVLDVKAGTGAFMQRHEDALELARVMVDLGTHFHRPVTAFVSRMDQPLGHAVGNALEIRECLDTLKGTGPQDLLELSLRLGEGMLELAQVCSSEAEARRMLLDALHSGRALQTFAAMIEAQGGNPKITENPSLLPESPIMLELSAPESGYIQEINALKIGFCAIHTGAGRRLVNDAIDPGAGILFHQKVGASVQKGEKIATVYSRNQSARESILKSLRNAIRLGPDPLPASDLLLYRVDRDVIRTW